MILQFQSHHQLKRDNNTQKHSTKYAFELFLARYVDTKNKLFLTFISAMLIIGQQYGLYVKDKESSKTIGVGFLLKKAESRGARIFCLRWFL